VVLTEYSGFEQAASLQCRYYDAVMMRNEFEILKAKHSGAA
jgi:hypothetical protein